MICSEGDPDLPELPVLADRAFEKSSRLMAKHPQSDWRTRPVRFSATHYPARLKPTCSLAQFFAAACVS